MRNRIYTSTLFLALMMSSLAGLARADEIGEAFDRGNTAFQIGQYERAIFEYQLALAWHGWHRARAHFNIGVCHYKLGHLREAVTEYRDAIKLRDGKYPSATYALGIALRDLGQKREAGMAFLQTVTASGGKHAEALFEVALESQRHGDYNSAIEYYQRAIIQSKDRIPACHNNLGVIFAQSGNLDEAMREFGAALKRAGSKFAEAQDNLDLCRKLTSPPSLIASLKICEELPGRRLVSE